DEARELAGEGSHLALVVHRERVMCVDLRMPARGECRERRGRCVCRSEETNCAHRVLLVAEGTEGATRWSITPNRGISLVGRRACIRTRSPNDRNGVTGAP